LRIALKDNAQLRRAGTQPEGARTETRIEVFSHAGHARFVDEPAWFTPTIDELPAKAART
jgi:hypothetical protein